MKLIVAGGRYYTDYLFVESKLDGLLINVTEDVEIVSGACDVGTLTFVRPDGTEVFGADGLGEKYAANRGYSVKSFPANWKKYGKPAGAIRNKEMAIYATHATLFWNGVSRGTKNMIELAEMFKLIYRVIRYK